METKCLPANNGLDGGDGGGSIGTFFVLQVQTWSKRVLMFLHRVNNTEHNIKQNICTGIDVISLIPQ